MWPPSLAPDLRRPSYVMQEPPYPSFADVDQIDRAIAGGRLPVRSGDLFSNRCIVIYLLDTSAIGALMRTDGRMAPWLSSTGADDGVVTCPIARGEILFGMERLAPGRRTELERKAQRLGWAHTAGDR